MRTTTLEMAHAEKAGDLLRILMLENSPDDAELILMELREAGLAFEHVLTEDQQQFIRAISSEDFDAILSDYRLPSWTGLDALKTVRRAGKDVPFLLVTGTLGEEAAVECIKQGVSDYVLKEHLSRLPQALERAIREKKLREEHQRSLAALAESEARARAQFTELDLLYRTAPICLAVLDRNLRYLRVNESMAQNHGIPPAAHIGRTLHEIVPENAEEAEQLYKEVFETGKPLLNVECKVKRTIAPFEERDYLATFSPLEGDDGTVSAACVIMVDITERKRAEEAMRRFEARNRDLVELSAYGICRVKADGEFMDSNPALLQMLGAETVEEVQELNFRQDVFRFPEQRAELLTKCQENGQAQGVEAEWRRRDGGFVSVRIHARRISPEGEPIAIEVMAEDVTRLRAMERQLHQAQKFEAIGQLAGGIAHDFNNVVGAILGWAELGCEQNKANPLVADRFTKIKEQADRAAALTRELLAFARRQVLQPKSIDLNAVTSGLVNFLGRVIGKNIELKIVTASLDPVKADSTQIEQVLMNLCINARDAMPDGGRLVVETEMADLDDAYCRFYPGTVAGRYAVICVSDTGSGMDAETREHIFEPFFTTKEQGKGTGMGLATVYGIVKQHGGFIHVYSEPGQGSLFRIYLPAIAGGVAEGTAPLVQTPSRTEFRGTELLLLAEDHESIREMARQTLVSLGYRVLAAQNGEEALELCDGEKPALAILDVVMPNLGGPATAKKLSERFPDLPVLYTSGYSEGASGVAPTSGENWYLQKPYSPTSLSRMVREILDEKNRAR